MNWQIARDHMLLEKTSENTEYKPIEWITNIKNIKNVIFTLKNFK